MGMEALREEPLIQRPAAVGGCCRPVRHKTGPNLH